VLRNAAIWKARVDMPFMPTRAGSPTTIFQNRDLAHARELSYFAYGVAENDHIAVTLVR